ncbi:MAG: hypothetical protein IT260_14100 [Saprospiraceae bacterium]|nr:hypothetical protein [Saprospiraceae bacterium]
MKTHLCLPALLLALSPAMAQQPNPPIALPDLVCSVQKSGNAILVSVGNNPDARESPACKASISIGGVTQVFSVPRLAPEAEYEKSIPIPANLLGAPILVKVKVDPDNTVPESNEGNNSCNKTVNRPDLAPVLMPGSTALNTRTDTRFLYFSVTNHGDGDARSSITSFAYSEGDNGKRNPMAISTPAIPAGGTVELQVSPKFCPHPESDGDCYWSVTVDVKKMVTESDETNNSASGGRQD